MIAPSLVSSDGALFINNLHGQIDIFNLQGERVASIDAQGSKAYILNLSPGAYFVRNATFSAKITVGMR